MDGLLTIGRFARLSGLTIGTLRHYDEVGLLVPAEVDQDTGYRRYREEQLARAYAIGRLRRAGLSLMEIAEALAADPPRRDELLGARRARIEAEITRLQIAHHRLGHLLDGKDQLMAPNTDNPLDAELERTVAARCFNRAWELMELPNRTPDQEDQLLHCAHAQAYHWRNVGEPVHFARSEWQCSRVYAVLGRPEPALWHARRCLELCEEHGIGDFDLAFAYEALARAHRVAGDPEESRRYRERAREASEAIAEDDDRELLLQDLATV